VSESSKDTKRLIKPDGWSTTNWCPILNLGSLRDIGGKIRGTSWAAIWERICMGTKIILARKKKRTEMI
jgi:hypothetical protein